MIKNTFKHFRHDHLTASATAVIIRGPRIITAGISVCASDEEIFDEQRGLEYAKKRATAQMDPAIGVPAVPRRSPEMHMRNQALAWLMGQEPFCHMERVIIEIVKVPEPFKIPELSMWINYDAQILETLNAFGPKEKRIRHDQD